MSRTVFATLLGAALILALAFRVVGLERRPMHHDEANQAVKFGALLEAGGYAYDRADHHGPTLYYLTLPSAWLRGQTTLASLDERTLRVVPALFGSAIVLLLLFAARGLGRSATAAAAVLTAVSPALTYYGRFYIQESIFLFFSLGFVVALGRYAGRPGIAWAAWTGLFAGLAYATKETSVIVVAAGIAACVLANPAGEAVTAPVSRGRPAWLHLSAGLSAAFAAAFLFYSSFLEDPGGFLESFRAFAIYLERGVEAGRHAHPWDYYLRLLAWSPSGGHIWSEAFILVMAIAGTFLAFRPATTGFWPRYVCLYSWLTALVFSLLRYKTPWNLLPFHAGFIVLAGIGVAGMAQRQGPGSPAGTLRWRRTAGDESRRGPLLRDRPLRFVLLGVFVAGSAHLAVQSWRANFRYPADPRNPYVYAHTSPDLLRLARRVEDLSAVHPDRSRMEVKVVAGPYEQWPLPWYLRRMTRVGYWSEAAVTGSLQAPVVIASEDNATAIDEALGDGWVSEFYGLRPDVLLTLYIERGLWEEFLGSRQQTVPARPAS